MGRPPLGGAPVFRFAPKEVAEMEKVLEDVKGAIPPRDLIQSLAEKFSASPERAGKVIVNSKQVWNWFQNRRYAQKSKGAKVPGKLNVVPSSQDDSATKRVVINSAAVPSGRKALDGAQMEFEAKSARDGACFVLVGNWVERATLLATIHVAFWAARYDVASFVTHRMFESTDPEVRVRFAGFGAEEDEWVNVKKCVRQRSLPCEASECVAVLPGDLILCFQEGKEQALYFDAHVLDAQRRRHDVRGCRCRFLVRYDHDQSEEIVPLRKICRRPETDYRLQLLHASRDLSSIELDQRPKQSKDLTSSVVTPFREATRDNFHFAPRMAKNNSENIDVNAQSFTAPMIYPVVHVQEAVSSEIPSNLAADSTKEITASEICQPLKMLDSTAEEAVVKPAVQMSDSTVEEAVVKPAVQMSDGIVEGAVVKPAVQMSDSTVEGAVVKPAVRMSDSTVEEAVVKPAFQMSDGTVEEAIIKPAVQD